MCVCVLFLQARGAGRCRARRAEKKLLSSRCTRGRATAKAAALAVALPADVCNRLLLLREMTGMNTVHT